jgi:hypothetical protein
MKPFSATFALAAILVFLTVTARPAVADAKSKAAQEVAQYVLERFGRQAAKDGVQALARRIEQTALKHGDGVFLAVRKLGPQGLHLIEEAGAHGKQVSALLAQYGEHGAVWVVSRPKGMALVLKHGEEAAAVLVKHKGFAEPVIEQLGAPAVRALQAVGTQNGRRLAMMAEGELAQIGRTPELLHVIGAYGDKAMAFVWSHKGALAVTAGLTAFLADPAPFIEGTKDLTKIVAENTVKPLAEVPAIAAREGAGEVARRTNWTLVFLAIIAVVALFTAARWGLFRRAATMAAATTGIRPPAAEKHG